MRSDVRAAIIAWLRARDKRRYGMWITHHTALGGANDLLAALHEAGFVVVPQSAIDWLDGAAPDDQGKWFGDDAPDGKPYWWRSRFRAMIGRSALTQTDGGG